jgi:hypothetical protein
VYIIILMVLTIVASALAQTGGGYDLTWSTIDGGGQMFSTGVNYELGGTIGQHDSGPQSGPLTGGDYSLVGGFWPAAASACACPGDTTGDGTKNGLDVQKFVNCLTAGGDCSCADLDGSSSVDSTDVGLLVDDLLTGAACP